MTFLQTLEKCIRKNNSLLCVGLDTDFGKLPKHLYKEKDSVFAFNKAIIDATHDFVCCYKLNLAFYEARALEGAFAIKKTVKYLKENYPDIPIIADAKRGDIGNTSEMYAKSLFDFYQFDAATVNPYLGFDSLEPFLKYREKGIIILCRTSNPGATDFQDTEVSIEVHPGGVPGSTPREERVPFYVFVARKVVEWSEKYKNCLMVVGATWPEEMRILRSIAPHMFFLVPGIGPQGADLEKTLTNGLTKEKSGLIISISRGIIYSDNPRETTAKMQRLINFYREK